MGNVHFECEFDPEQQAPEISLQQLKELVRTATFPSGTNKAYNSLTPINGRASKKLTGLKAVIDEADAATLAALLNTQFGVL